MTGLDRAVVVLQARMGSRRLPGKALHLLAGRPLVSHCLERLIAADVGPVVLATTVDPVDGVLAEVGQAAGVTVVRGSVHDVLGRFAQVLVDRPATVVIRATADNPAVDVDAPARALGRLAHGVADYVTEEGLPYGAAVEAVRAEVLRRACQLATDAADREHVTTWIKRHRQECRVRIARAPADVRRPDLRLTVDTPIDLAYMRRVLAAAGAEQGIVPLGQIIAAADRVGPSTEVA
jgi:spore coat polysaccharide biosynthesis protein SpsF